MNIKSYFKKINWSNIKKAINRYWQSFLVYIKNPQKIYASNSLLLVLLLLGILIIINLVAAKENLSFDATKNKRFSLSKQTITLLKELKDEVKVTAFFNQGSTDKDLLTSYQDQSKSKIKIEFVDPVKQPGIAQKYAVKQYGTVVFESGDKQEIITNASESEYSGAILRLVHRETNKVGFLAGHGEKSLESSEQAGYSSLKAGLEKNGYKVEELNLLKKEASIPDDVSVLVIAGPQNSLLDQEADLISQYLDKGGKLFLMFDVDAKNQSADKNLGKILEKLGVEVKNGIVLDPLSSSPEDIATTVVQKYESSQITKNLAPSFFTGAIALVEKDSSTDYTVTKLAKTSSESWLETNLSSNQVAYDQDSDTKGPITLAATMEKSADGKSRVVVVTDSDFLDNAYYSAPIGNSDLFMNSLRWLLAQEELLDINPKEELDTSVYLTGNQSKYIFWGTVVGMPLIFVAIGITVWYTRRRRRL